MRKKKEVLILVALVLFVILRGNLPFGHTQPTEPLDFSEPITQLDIDIDLTDIVIDTSDASVTTVNLPELSGRLADQYEFFVEVNNGTLEITGDRDRGLINGMFDWFSFGNNITEPLYVHLAQGTELDSMDLHSSMGNAELTNVRAGDAMVDLAMGDLHLAANEWTNTHIDLAMGNLYFSDDILYNSFIDLAMGDISGEVAMLGDHELITSMGDIQLGLLQNEANTTVEADVTMGNSNIRTGLDASQPEPTRNDSKTARITLEINMGDLNLQYID